MTNIKTILAVIALMTVFVLGGVVGWIIKPGVKTNQSAATVPKVTVQKVIENPTPKQTKAADAVITKRTTIKASGTVTAKPKATATAKESKYTIPLNGEATTTYIDAETGATVGAGTHQVTGQVNVTVQDDVVKVDTVINDTNQVAVTTSRITRKNEAGYFYDGDQQIYYKRNVFTFGKKIELSAYVGGRLNIDDVDESRAEVGVRVRW
jgi:hypothetical protein